MTAVLPVSTADGVALRYPLAGVAARGLATAVDLLIGAACAVPAWRAGLAPEGPDRIAWHPVGAALPDAAFRLSARAGPTLLLAAVVVPLLSELLTGGRTPGKWLLGLRVRAEDGGAADISALLVRNVFRLVDLLPGTYAVGAVAVAVGGRRQRLGDLLARTVVVSDRVPVSRYALGTGLSPDRLAQVPDARTWDISGLEGRHRAVLQEFALRRHVLPAGLRATLAEWLADILSRRVVGAPSWLGPEDFLDALLVRVTAGSLRA
jgi:uncharacterized RDD family membrane protein YckC